MIRSLELVVHCWSGDDVPIYHHLLKIQLHSLLNYRDPLLHVKATICYTPNDTRTAGVLSEYAPLFEDTVDLKLVGLPLTPSNLFRRAIGRNIAARRTGAAVVWFTDVDYVFGVGALGAAHDACMASDGAMVYPRHVRICKSHFLGDLITSNVATTGRVDMGEFCDDVFVKRREKIAIGGIQIVKGEHCRTHGYLDGTKWVKPVESDHMLQCHCDTRYRKTAGGAQAVDIPNVYRIRHSRCGRDRGDVDHGRRDRE